MRVVAEARAEKARREALARAEIAEGLMHDLVEKFVPHGHLEPAREMLIIVARRERWPHPSSQRVGHDALGLEVRFSRSRPGRCAGIRLEFAAKPEIRIIKHQTLTMSQRV
jgi:hypothetical protein